MNFTKGDIVNKSDTIWVSQKFVNDLINKNEHWFESVRSRYKSSVQKCSLLKDSGKGWRWGIIIIKFYYALDNIPNRKPTYYRDLFGDREELVNMGIKKQWIIPMFLY